MGTEKKQGKGEIASMVADALAEGGEKAERIRRARSENARVAAKVHAAMPNLAELNRQARAVGVQKKREELETRDLPPCPRCQSNAIKLNGKRPSGEQYYKCVDCARQFLDRRENVPKSKKAEEKPKKSRKRAEKS